LFTLACRSQPRTWQKACRPATSPAGGAASTTSACAPVPTISCAWPGRTVPVPTAAACWSPAPNATGCPRAGRGGARRSGVSRPAAAPGSPSAGMSAGSRPNAASVAVDQRGPATSNISVADASVGSLPSSPVNRWRSASLASSSVRARASEAGSCSRSHASGGSVSPRTTGLASSSRRPAASIVAATSGSRPAARVSIQVMAGRTVSPAASSSTKVCIWPLRPIPTTSAPGASASTPRVASPAAAHQSSGSCSAQPGAGARVG
jgi:hypothetical protein